MREGFLEELGLVEVRLDDLCENPAWRQQTGSSILERCLMFLTIGRDSGGRGRPGKHVGNTENHSGKLLPVCAATVKFDGNRVGQPQTAGNCRENACTTPSTIRGKLLPVWCCRGGTRPKSSRLAWNSREQSRCIKNRDRVSAGGVVKVW